MTGKMFKMCAMGLAVVGLAVLTNLNAQAAVTYRTVAVTGVPAPGADDGAEFLLFSAPALNNAGGVVFGASLRTGTGVEVTPFNNVAIFGPTETGFGLIVREDDPAPGVTDGAEFSFTKDPVLNDSGDVAFFGSLRTGTGAPVTIDNWQAVFGPNGSGLDLIARQDHPAPDVTDSAEFNQFSFLRLTNVGDIVFSTFLRNEDNTLLPSAIRAIYSSTGSGLSLIAREDNPAPGIPDGTDIFRLLGPAFAVNNVGDITFSATLWRGTVTQFNDKAIFGPTDSGLGPIAREGDSAPGFNDGTVLIGVGSAVLNDSGSFAYNAFLPNSDNPVNPFDDLSDEAIFGPTPSGLGLIVRENEPAPGVDDAKFDDFSGLRLNNANEIAFSAILRNTDNTVDHNVDRSVFGPTSSGLKLIARENDPVPDTADGVRFNWFGAPGLNDAGDIAFFATLRSGTTEIVDSNDEALFAYSKASDKLMLIVRKGDLYDVNDDPLIEDLQTIRSFSFGTNSAFNDAGQLAFKLHFTDDSEGIFVATIPEPASLALFVAGAGWVLGRRRVRFS